MKSLFEEYGEFIVTALFGFAVIAGLGEILAFVTEGTFLLGTYF